VVVFHAGPRKKDDRAIEKAKLCYDDNYDRLKDMRRASIVCGDITKVVAVMLALEAGGIDIRRIKNRFDRNYKAAQLSAGHRDLQLNVCIPGTGLIWELQIHLVPIEELKSKLRDLDDGFGSTGHQRNVAFRTIMERIKHTMSAMKHAMISNSLA